jgi:threonine synthase
MSLVTKLVCVQCGTEFREGDTSTCPACGPDEGILDVCFDLDKAAQSLTRSALKDRTRSHWRYRELLPIDDAFCPTEGNIGWTPLIEAPRLAKMLGIARLRLKDDGRNASGSFKDRASSVGVARALQEGATSIACASTGNAASSLAHCAATTGLQANIFVSRIVPEGKLAQLLAYGARVFKVEGTYAQAYDLCTQACERFGWYNRNAAINPYLVEGKKTGGLEVAEQCADDPPDWVVCSVGDGCSIAGVYKGFVQMRAIGVIDWPVRMLGAQADGVAPISEAYNTGKLDRAGTGTTYADSINVPVPRNWRKAVNAVRESEGAYVCVSDDAIMEAVRTTGRLAGVFAEPAAATAVAAIASAREKGILDARSSVVAMITGNGLKDIQGAIKAVGSPNVIKPDIESVEEVVTRDQKQQARS